MPPARHLASVVLLLAVVPAPGTPAQEEEPPRRLVEETTSRLAQIDVTVSGPHEVVSTLGPEDFRLKVHMRWLDAFELDRFCAGPDEPGLPAAETGLSQRAPVNYVFYFDQTHLTLGGRARAMGIARVLVERLLTNGDRAMVVSDAGRLAVIEEFTDDPARLLEALDRLENDRTQWDFYATQEDGRVARVVDYLNRNDNVHGAIGAAKTFQREEMARNDRSLRRLAITLTRLSELDSHKAVVYFADTMRQNPGEHYLTFFSYTMQRATPGVSDMASEAFMSGNVFDRVVNEATAQGIRFYTVYAQGLVTPFDRDRVDATGLELTGTVPASARTRFRDSQDTLASLASETGGGTFLRGENPTKISQRILEDFSCLYTLSFDPSGFPQDNPLRVIVDVKRKGVRLRVRGRLVLPSEKSLRASRLLAAFAFGDGEGADLVMHANLIPTGYHKGAYGALLQVSVPGSKLLSASWELGASLINRDRVLDEVSGTLSVRHPGVPLVLEREITIRPGPHEVVAVAHEATTDFVLSEHVQLSWPDPDHQPVTCGPLALLQPTSGAFVRGEATRTRGSLARSPTEPVNTALPTALMGLVCRSRRHRGTLRVERSLIGSTAVDFPLLQFALDRERCAQVRDLIPAGSLSPGPYRYLLRVVQDGQVLHEASREFRAASPES